MVDRRVKRYARLFFCLARYCLARELSFRFNFAARCLAGLAWLAMLVIFFQLIYLRTDRIGDWTMYQFLVFQGTAMILNSLINTFVLTNLGHFTELVRTGDLDLHLVKPIDEQFLISLERVDWSEFPKLFGGGGLILYAYLWGEFHTTLAQGLVFLLFLAAGAAILYSLLLAMASSSVWIVRNTGLYELWFYVTQFARYPSDIYGGNWLGLFLSFTLTFVLPVLLAVSLPARVAADLSTDWRRGVYLLVAAGGALVLSRWFFRFALQRYRSASS